MSHSILVIDDNELNLTLAEKILTLSGYEVGSAVRHAAAISAHSFADRAQRSFAKHVLSGLGTTERPLVAQGEPPLIPSGRHSPPLLA